MSSTVAAPVASIPRSCQELDAAWADEVAAGLVAGEPGLVDERDPGAAAGEDQRGDAAGRAGPDDEGVETPVGFIPLLSIEAYRTSMPSARP